MTKLSFVALSLQTTHLDPASLSKAAYVKIVDGHVTRQAEMTIANPTADQPADAHDDALTWDVALEKLRMVIGRLPIVSYYRDADKEIFQAASRHLDITPPVFHWLDCRELVRQHLPDLPDTQLSTVLKALDLYDEHADATTVQQTGQIVIALAQRQHATTADQLWDDLYHQPDDPLGLNDTFEGIASIDGTADDAEDLSAREPAATTLPTTGAVPVPHSAPIAKDFPDTAHATTQQDIETADIAAEARPHIAELLPTSQNQAFDEQPDDEAMESFSHEPSEASDQDPETTTVEADEVSADEISGHAGSPTAVAEDAQHAQISDDSEQPDLNDESQPDGQDLGEPARDAQENSETTSKQLPEVPLFLQQAPREETAASETGAEIGEPPLTKQTVTEEPAPGSAAEVTDIGDREQVDADDTADLQDDQPDVDQPDVVHDSSDLEQAEDPDGPTGDRNSDDVVASDDLDDLAAGEVPEPHAPPAPDETSDAPVAQPDAEQRTSHQSQYVASVPLGERPATVEETQSASVDDAISRKRRSASGRIFSLFGILLFGVLTVVGLALTVLAVMLFFTTNTLILETKIAGVLLTLAITLLAALMTHTSYRGFRKR